MKQKVIVFILSTRILSAAEVMVQLNLERTSSFLPSLAVNGQVPLRVSLLYSAVSRGEEALVQDMLKNVTIDEVRGLSLPNFENIMHLAARSGRPAIINHIRNFFGPDRYSGIYFEAMMKSKNDLGETPDSILSQLSVTCPVLDAQAAPFRRTPPFNYMEDVALEEVDLLRAWVAKVEEVRRVQERNDQVPLRVSQLYSAVRRGEEALVLEYMLKNVTIDEIRGASLPNYENIMHLAARSGRSDLINLIKKLFGPDAFSRIYYERMMKAKNALGETPESILSQLSGAGPTLDPSSQPALFRWTPPAGESVSFNNRGIVLEEADLLRSWVAEAEEEEARKAKERELFD